MFAEYKEYRNQNQVVPYLDIITYPDGYKDGTTPQPVFSKWALNLKSSGNLDKGAVVGNAAKAALSLGGGLLMLGAGVGGVAAGLSEAGNSVGKAVNAAGKSNVSTLGMAADAFINQEKNNWEDYYRLMSFEPAQGNLGDQHIGKTVSEGCLGHWFYENGDYFEGFLYNNGARQGIFVFADGLRYYGAIVEGLKVDYGIEIAPDGSRIYGTFTDGMLTSGMYECDTYASVGDWSNGVLHGFGASRYADNSVFVGDWSHGKPVQ